MGPLVICKADVTGQAISFFGISPFDEQLSIQIRGSTDSTLYFYPLLKPSSQDRADFGTRTNILLQMFLSDDTYEWLKSKSYYCMLNILEWNYDILTLILFWDQFLWSRISVPSFLIGNDGSNNIVALFHSSAGAGLLKLKGLVLNKQWFLLLYIL